MNNSTPKVALVHDYLIQYGGAEKTLEAVSDLYPEAPIYTGIYEPANLSQALNNKKIIQPSTGLFKKFPKYLSFFMPLVFENFNLKDYDIILSDTACWAKGVLANPKQLHISYIHTPPRFLYKYSVESTKRNAWYFKPFVTVIDSFLRIWDYAAAQRPDFLLTNSEEVKKRIKKFYGRDAKVIYPPVEINYSKHIQDIAVPIEEKDFYIAVGRLVAYKNFDLLIKAFNTAGLPLVIVGTGVEEEKLKALAGPNIKFTGKVSDDVKHALLERSLGLIYPVKDEDFGIVPIEAMAHGKPVLAHRSGGALETVTENETGMFFDKLEVDELIEKIKVFHTSVKGGKFDAQKIKQSTEKYSKERFKQEFSSFVSDKWLELREKHARTS
jgi:glycosyltransferase involved in cell wall biosynthesis